MPFAPFLKVLRETARRLKYHLIVILIARQADCPWVFEQLDRDWASIHDVTGSEVVFLTVDGEDHIPVKAGENGFSLRSDMGSLRGNYGLVAFSASCRLLNRLDDRGLDSRQTAAWNEHSAREFVARHVRPRARRGEWTDNHSLAMSAVIGALPGVTEGMLPCLHMELVHADHSFTLPLRRASPDDAPTIYDALRKMMIESAPQLPRIMSCGDALHAQGAIPRKATELAASMVWLKNWTGSQPGLPAEIRQFIASALDGHEDPACVYRAISSLRDNIDPPAFTALRAHLNRVTAAKAFLPLAAVVSDRSLARARCSEICVAFEIIVRRLFKNHTVEGECMDPVSIITLISSGLKLVDQFRELAIRFKGQNPTPPSGKAEQVGTALEVRHGAQVDQRIEANQLHMDQWDTVRYDALSKRIRTQWGIYNDLFADEAGAAIQERARVRADMRNIQGELCRDFKEMIHLYERALGTSLPDHYQLYEVCQG